MSTAGPAYPTDDTWVAAVHVSEHDFAPIGGAVVIDEDRVLTCAHVIVKGGATREPLWIAFPKAANSARRRVISIARSDTPEVYDLPVLVLQEPVPHDVVPARLRCPKPTDLVNHDWRAFGFPAGDPVGNEADGVVGPSLGYGWVRLDTRSRYPIEEGFSGSGLWSPEYGAVVAIVGQAQPKRGDGRALTLHQADLCLPDQQIAVLATWNVESAGMVALEQWGWMLANDPEGTRHWQPRARGVTVNSERGYRFRGRTAALTKIVRWLDRSVPDRRVLVVTGSPGVGKSAVLGRIVTTADPVICASLPTYDQIVRAREGSVACAVHAKAKTALEVAEEIARAASARLPHEPDDLAPAIRETLADRNGLRFNVIIDALDEAASAAQTRAIIEKIVLPLAETCSDIGVQVIVGTRRNDDGGNLLERFGSGPKIVDLDDSDYLAKEDLVDYALACLQLAGDDRPANPYANDAVATPLARQIAAMASGNFLVAGLISRSHGLYDNEPADPTALGFTVTVESALANYVARLCRVGQLSADCVLTALAFAEAPGLPIQLWQVAIEAIYGEHVTATELMLFVRSSAANFLVETSVQPPMQVDDAVASPVYRLFHQALNDSLLRSRSDITVRAADERRISEAFIASGRRSGWRRASTYLLRSLGAHAARASMMDEILAEDEYLLYANLRRLLPATDGAISSAGRARASLLRLTPQAISATAATRVALFSVTEALENLDESFIRSDRSAPYRARWASVRPRTERTIIEGHTGEVNNVCAVSIDGRTLLATASDDKTVRLWDPVTGEQRRVLEGHTGWVNSVCTFSSGGQVLLASAGDDETVRLWDPATGEQQRVLQGHTGGVRGVCGLTVNGRALLATASADRTIRLWDQETTSCLKVIPTHHAPMACDHAKVLIIALTAGLLAIDVDSVLEVS